MLEVEKVDSDEKKLDLKYRNSFSTSKIKPEEILEKRSESFYVVGGSVYDKDFN